MVLTGVFYETVTLYCETRGPIRGAYECVCVCVKEAQCCPPNTSLPKAAQWNLSHNSQGSGLKRGDGRPAWSRHGDGQRGKSILGETGNWGEGAEHEGRVDQFCCLILLRLWINVYFKTSFSLPLFVLHKHWHSSCWFLTFVDRDLILSNILDLLFQQWFSCSSAAGPRELCTGRAPAFAAPLGFAAAQTQRAATFLPSSITAHTWTHLFSASTPNQSRSDCYQIALFSTSVTHLLLTAWS